MNDQKTLIENLRAELERVQAEVTRLREVERLAKAYRAAE